MDFYISWSHSDAVFSDYFDSCPMLISAIPDNKYALKKFNRSPQKIIIDSGAFYYSRQNVARKLKDIMDIQCYMIDGAPNDVPIKIVHLDEPLTEKKALTEKYNSIEKTLLNAYEHFNLFQMEGFPQNISMMGVIQGFDFASIQFSIHELKKMGYTSFGIGSLLKKSAKDQISIINFISEIVGSENLHVFGVTGIPQIKEMAKLKISSFDSSRPTMVAAYHQIIYSNPFRIFLISESNVTKTQKRISKPLNCNCPVCNNKPEDIMKIDHRNYTKLRSIHNYYHLIETIKDIKREVL
ncbi:tRNA-guanine transglycosylase [Bacillus sp. V59.32b]|uniref:tRNA-guanine transglycosylase n=1 Tax=Bacillus sp. V59.32b TaxID=1758642 RepID=UPI000E3CB65B|nr:tRNA-guanine transglycosylase [Bacillus sp. V59.32b]RFU70004.1 tRNA-guanine transglycosylase [Bacillus sp. V59.32b]